MALAQMITYLRSLGSGTARAAAVYLEDRLSALEAGSTGLQLASTAPADVTKAAAAVGNGTTAARANHKHDISTAAASGLTSASANAEGSATSLARSDHAHAITGLDGRSAAVAAEKTAGALAGADFACPLVLILNIPAAATADLDFTAAPFKIRVLDVLVQKTTTSADTGDKGQLQTAAGAAITNDMSLNVADGEHVRPETIDPATHEIAAAGTLRWHRTQATNAACKVILTVVRVA